MGDHPPHAEPRDLELEVTDLRTRDERRRATTAVSRLPLRIVITLDGRFLRGTGCYILQASWPGGSWRVTFAAGR